MKRIGLAALALASSLAVAESSRNSTYEYTDTRQSLDQQAATQLTNEERSLARQWQLTDSDWVKFKQIMEGPRGIWSPGLDPITALGVSETDPKERDRYAEIWMRVEARRKELELAFERARTIAAKKVLGDMKAVNNDEWIADWNRKYTSVNKHVALFMDSSCMKDCKRYFDDIYDSLNSRTRLDVYFEAGATKGDIRDWAVFMELDPEVVKARRVTLNFDEGTAARKGVDTSQLPQVREVLVN